MCSWNDSAAYEGLAIMMAGLAIASVIIYFDIKEFRIPDILSAGLALIGFIWALYICDRTIIGTIINGSIAACIFLLLRWAYFKLRKVHGLGLGDVKLIAAIAVWTGLMTLPILVLVACIVGAIHLLYLSYQNQSNIHRGSRLPFGAHLCLAFVCLNSVTVFV